MKDKGIVIVISGPSGCGKSTILKKLLSLSDKNKLSISTTTRKMREGEKNGVNYNFTTKEKFEDMIKNNEMLEYASYCGNYYGTPKTQVEKFCEMGYNIILEIEVNGAMQIKQKIKDAIMIFLIPPSFHELQTRLVNRETEDIEVIKERLGIALTEIKLSVQYDYIVVNNDIDEAIKNIIDIINVKKLSTKYMEDFIIEVIKNAKTSDN